MKILITGANGFLSYYMVDQLLNNNHTVIATGKGESRLPFIHPHFMYEELDFTNAGAVAAIFAKHQPTHIIHAGAISKPDECELNKPVADKVNIEGTAILLAAAKDYAAVFLFCSTDFIFDGIKGMYNEEDTPAPVNYYGETKVKAEALVQQYPHHWNIVRTVLNYGKPFNKRNNILTIVQEKLEKGEAYEVFHDQVRTPTYAGDFAWAINAMLEKNVNGIYNICGEDVLTPYEMAVATGAFLQLDTSLIKKITAKDFVQAAKRPLKTGLDITKAKRDLGYQPVSFNEGLKKTLG
ncbi:SDR family oxidoreductase [Ferruginibacter sp. SUN106]|uniref:SDR family oxidoreductase n=1 Tax=Ferruginibacter sp. SUN106 TaxID=2978348 RepID=UPI003D36AA0A